MIMKVIGVERTSGQFTDPKSGKEVAYNNIKIHAVKPNTTTYKDENFGSGKLPVTVKIQNIKEVIEAIFGSVLTKDDLLSMVDQDYDFYFTEKGAIDRIIAPAPPPAIKKGA